MIASPLRLGASLLFAAVLTGCATVSVDDTRVAAYRQDVDVSGRLSVRYQKDGKEESLSGKFTWSQHGSQIDVSLASPLGETIATIHVTPQAATLTQRDQQPRVAPDVNTLTAQSLGWSLPVAGLRDWLQGYADSADGSRFIASRARNSVQTRDGWRLRYVSWDDGAQPVPKRIDAERSATAASDEVAIRIVIDQP